MKGKGNGMRNGMATAFILCMMGSMLLAGCGRAKSTPDLSTSAEETGAAETTYEGEFDTVYDRMDNPDGGNEGGDTEEYSQLTETGFVSVYNNPLSTFSADVDTAS